jgi:hypothetical protein
MMLFSQNLCVVRNGLYGAKDPDQTKKNKEESPHLAHKPFEKGVET